MLRFLEIAWLAVAVVTGLVTCYLLLTRQFSESLFMIICSAIALTMYFVRRRQRIRYDVFRNKEKDESHYH